MERLRGIDAAFLYTETPTAHMHTMKVAVLELAPGVDYGIARVKADLAARLHLLPPFRRRLVEVPLGLHHPVWIEDATFDLDRHVKSRRVPPPGGPREVDAVISDIASVPLDRRWPLWELWLIEGLAGGRVAAVGKIHHAVADGVAVAGLLANVMDPGLRDLAASAEASPWSPETVPSPARLVGDALSEHVRQLDRLPRLVGRTVRNLVGAARRRRAAAVVPPIPIGQAPRTSINGALTPERVFASTALPLGVIKAVKDTFGVTLNDVLLALVASALSEHLGARGERPSRPLLAEVPVATDAPGMRRIAGNRLSNLFTSLCTDVEDRATRLRAIHRVTASAKEVHLALGPDLYEAWMAYVPPRPFAWAMRLYSRWRLADRHAPPVNVIISCVPGPRIPLRWPGGRLEAIYSVGPIIEGVGLNVTAWSYIDRLCVGVLACPRFLPDPGDLAERLHVELTELAALASAHRPETAALRGAGSRSW
jgi:WS/DGAT/MGAT family acyltransferase